MFVRILYSLSFKGGFFSHFKIILVIRYANYNLNGTAWLPWITINNWILPNNLFFKLT